MPEAPLHAFLLDLGGALTLAGAAVSETQERLLRVAAANGATEARVLVFPTALIVSTGAEDRATIDAIPSVAGGLPLDQVSALYELLDLAETGAIAPAEGRAALREIRAREPRHGAIVELLSYAVLTVGLCLILQPTPVDVAISFGLGLVVGAFLLLARGHDSLTALLPVLCATAVAAISFEAVSHEITDDAGLRTLIAPLVTFLPGAMLTTATVELASGQMMAGATRLVTGGVQLLLLAFGIVAGAELVGLPRDAAFDDSPANLLGSWAPWLGVVVFGVGAAFYFQAPRRALPWLLLVIVVAWFAQQLGSELIGAEISGFAGALAMTPVALAVAKLPGGPPSQVTFLPAFWLLVPGAIGLLGVTTIVGDPASASVGDLVQPMGSIISVALGVLCGVTLFRGLDSTVATVRGRSVKASRRTRACRRPWRGRGRRCRRTRRPPCR